MVSASENGETPSPRADGWIAFAPALFVFLWSTGFIGAKFGLPYIEPLTFLSTRFVIVALLMLPIALVLRARWPDSWMGIAHVGVSGLLIHATYLGGVFLAIDRGLSAGVSALVVSLQPVLVATAVGPLLGEKVTRPQWLGLILGVLGVALVVQRKISVAEGDMLAVLYCVAGVVGMSAGTIYQKRYCGGMDARSGVIIQCLAGAALLGALAIPLEAQTVEYTWELGFAYFWLCVPLSIGAVLIFWRLVRLGAASKVSGLFFLVPPSAALIAYPMFGETLGPLSLVGMALAALGVYLVMRDRAGSP